MEIKRYKGICPVCGAELWIQPSVSMLNGWHNGGHGTCYSCKTFLHLEFKPEELEFNAVEFQEWLKSEC